MPMSKLELYLTADMRDKVRYLSRKGIIQHFKAVSAKKNPHMVVREYCIEGKLYCADNISCSECWELVVRTVLSEGGPVL